MSSPRKLSNSGPVLEEIRRAAGQAAPDRADPALRLPRLIGCAPEALARFRSLRLAIVGVGAVGGSVALHLVRSGVAALILIDPKRFKQESLLTHEAGPADVGRPKALVVARRCKEIAPSTRILAFAGPVEALPVEALTQVDVVIMSPDLLSVEVELGQRCLHLGIPLVQSSVHGESLVAQVRLYANAVAAGCCAGCFLGREEWRQLSRQTRYSCEGASADQATAQALPLPANDAPVTASFRSLCSLASGLAVNQVMRFFLQLGEPVADTQLEFCGVTNRTVISRLVRNPDCPLDHFVYRRVNLNKPPGHFSLAALAEAAIGAVPGDEALFELPGLDWVEFGRCACARMRPVWRFVPRGQPRAFDCAACGAPVVPLQFYVHRRVSASLLGSALKKPLGVLGAGRVRGVWVRQADTGALMLQSNHRSSQP